MRRLLSEIGESMRIAAEQIRAHKMRAGLTATGVIIGVLAVTLMGTAVKGIEKSFDDSLKMIGTDVFYVSRWPWRDVGDDWRTFASRPMIEEKHAERINRLIAETGSEALELAVPEGTRHRSIRYGRNVVESAEVTGTTSAYMRATAFKMGTGRFFSENETRQGVRVAVLGTDIAEALFPNVSPIGARIVISDMPFEVIGTLDKQGSFLGLMSMDRRVVVPIAALKKISGRHREIDLLIKKRPEATKEAAHANIEDLMRRARELQPEQQNDFEINSTDIIEEDLGPVLNGIAIAGLAITGMSLMVGAIGIMNITFVSVRERTREIGTRRALGASRRAILIQFLMEAVSICLLGGVIGLLQTYLIGRAVQHSMPDLPMVFSPDLIVLGLVVSVGVGVLSGIVPAWMASRLDPATALRHD